MALFSRRSQPDDDPLEADGPSSADDPSAAEEAATPSPADLPPTEPVPHVGISVSTYGAPPPRATARPATPPANPPSATVPDNTLVRQALAALGASPDANATMNVARQVLQGHLYLRVKGDARALLAERKPLPLAMAQHGDQKFALAYSGTEALQASVRADGDTQTTAMAQPVLTVIDHVLSGDYAGLLLDHANEGARAVLPRQLLERIRKDADDTLTIKTLLAGPRSPETTVRIVRALRTAPLWMAANKAADGETVGIAEARSKDGARHVQLYSHPMEVIAAGRGDRPVPLTADQLARALRSDPDLAGVLLDPSGPWMALTRADLAPLIDSEG